MICTRKSASLALAVAAMVFSVTATSKAENKRLLGDVKIDDNVTVTLRGNTRPEINARNDRGAVSPELQMDHLQLLLKRTPETEDALTKFINTQYDPKSPNFHKWLSAAQLGEKFGPAQSDVETVKSWLESQGLTVNTTYGNRMFIDFSGSARNVETAFHTEIRNYEINGEMRTANSRDPQIPAALADVVHGVVSLNNFRPKAMHVGVHEAHLDARSGEMRSEYTHGGTGHGDVEKDYTNGGGYETIVPYDLAKIYNIAPLFTAGISGQGMKIVVVEDTNLWNCNATNTQGPCSATSDSSVFRNTFGLSRYSAGSVMQEMPGPTVGTSCTTPSTGRGYPAGSGINADDVEAAIDVQWATAAAPSATVINAACANPSGGFGGLTAIQNILNRPSADNVDVISMSYGESEEQTGATLNAAFNTTFKAASTAGVAIFVSSGDEDAASSDGEGVAKDGITISGWMSSPYDVSVGGLDFADNVLGTAANYWNANNNVFYGSAKSYIPEQPWNDSCASVLLSLAEGYSTTYGTSGFCNSSFSISNGFDVAAGGSGGPSACATGTRAVAGVAGGTCAGYAKPSWQTGVFGVPADGVRDTPDVSLMAANGLWGHYFIICYSDSTSSGKANGSVACTGQPATWAGYGGTSVSSPIFAGIQALVVQHKGGLQGLPTPRYYALAAAEYGASGNAACNSEAAGGPASSCVFNDITLGDIDAACQAHSGGTKYNCYLPSGTYGVLSTDNNSYKPAYGTTSGWDFSTGIGSVNAYNLVMSF